ncbi:septation protein SepH [Microbacterium halophytorum]|uniref:septation protein SepH n=1 Tax=Microbacterium halophytorum TaxID=2067568 RepID=UPI000CFD94FF|nr:septation protein SepH [Microbacterium halophytorum]
MEQLTIIGSEDGRLILADESGQRFALAVDDVLRSEVRSNGREQKPAPVLSASPRDIQARIRAGLSAEETAELLSVDIDVVRKFETPVIAEREHIVDRALAVPVVIGSEFDPEENPTFGTALRAKLADLGATGERWTSWKDDSGWTVKLEFTANEVEHDARWQFEPRRSALAPANGDATQLSRQGPLPEGLIPRLRAVDADPATPRGASAAASPRPERPSAPAAPADEPSADTVDLLEALRRKRGQREAAPATELDESTARHPAKGRPTAPVSLFDLVRADEPAGDEGSPSPVGASHHLNAAERPTGGAEREESAHAGPVAEPAPDEGDERQDAQRKQESSKRRGRRAALPSWDDIVFGARGDD